MARRWRKEGRLEVLVLWASSSPASPRWLRGYEVRGVQPGPTVGELREPLLGGRGPCDLGAQRAETLREQERGYLSCVLPSGGRRGWGVPGRGEHLGKDRSEKGHAPVWGESKLEVRLRKGAVAWP